MSGYGPMHYAYVSESEISDALEALRLTLPGLNYLETAERILYEITGEDVFCQVPNRCQTCRRRNHER